MAKVKTTVEPIGWAAWGGHTRADLLGVDEWRVLVNGKDDPQTARNLALVYQDWPRGPEYGHYGPAILADLAKRMGGTWWFEKPPPSPGEN